MKSLSVYRTICLLVWAGNPLAAAAAPCAELPTAALGGITSLTLDHAIQLALTNNPRLRVSAWAVSAAQARALQATRWSNPELEFGSEDIPLTGGNFRDSKNTIGISQTVPWPGKKRLDLRIGLAGVAQAEANLQNGHLELIREVKIAFYRSLALERVVEVAGDLVKVADSSASTARKRVEAGAAPDQELLRAEIQLEQAIADAAGFRRDLAAVREELAELVGLPVSEVPLVGALADKPAPVAGGDDNALPQSHASLAPFEAARRRAELEWRRARLEPYPDVRMGVDGGREGRDDNAIIQFRVSVPLPIFDRVKGRTAEARAEFQAAEAQLAAASLRLERDYAVIRQRFAAAVQQLTAYRDRIVPRADQALKLVRTGFDEGKFTFIDLLDTQRTTAEAHLAYQQKLLDLSVAQAELETLLDGASPSISKFSTTSSP